MKRALMALPALALAACSRMTTPEDIAIATEMCAKRGGYASVSSYERGEVVNAVCTDGLVIEVRLSWVKK